jgi:hypothetical protein
MSRNEFSFRNDLFLRTIERYPLPPLGRPDMPLNEQLELHSRSQRERLAYVDFRLYFMGEIRRADLLARFQMKGAAATRDLALYRELAPENLHFDGVAKSYRITTHFRPLFDHPLERVISAITFGFGEGADNQVKSLLPCESPSILNRPNIGTVAAVTRAISLKRPLLIKYYSLSSGLSEREIVPFALVDSGLRWHVRAYDRKRSKFLDFVLTRMTDPIVLESEIVEHETATHDHQWNRVVELDLVPHPESTAEIVAMDFGMVNNRLRIQERAAVVGYVLRRWFVDCSPDHSIRDAACCLGLSDPLVLYGVENAHLAPGYVNPSALPLE